MSSGDGDSLNIAESVQLFLRYVLDQVVYSSVENEKDEGRILVLSVLGDVVQEAVRSSEGKESIIQGVKREKKDIAQDKSQNIEVDVSIHVKQKDFEEGPDIFVKSTKHIVDADTEKDDRRLEEIFSGNNTDTDITRDNKGHRNTTSGSNDATSGNITNRLLTRDNISEVSVFADRLEGLTNKCDGQQQFQSIKLLQLEYTESIADEKLDGQIGERANEQKWKVFTPFSKLKTKKTRYGKVKIYHTGDLSAEEQKRIVKEATELMKYLKKKEKEEKRRKRAAKEKKGIGARIWGFFRSLSCCKASTDVDE